MTRDETVSVLLADAARLIGEFYAVKRRRDWMMRYLAFMGREETAMDARSVCAVCKNDYPTGAEHSCPPDFGRDSLTFAEAMALDPSEVEMLWSDTPIEWKPLGEVPYKYELSAARRATYRRARPRRSRVQEMARGTKTKGCVDCGYDVALESAFKTAIRAVCEYMRSQDDNGTAEDVERHFLEPR